MKLPFLVLWKKQEVGSEADHETEVCPQRSPSLLTPVTISNGLLNVSIAGS